MKSLPCCSAVANSSSAACGYKLHRCNANAEQGPPTQLQLRSVRLNTTLAQLEVRRQGGRQRERGDAARNGCVCEWDHAGLIFGGVEPTQSSLTLNNTVGVSTLTDGGDESRVE